MRNGNLSRKRNCILGRGCWGHWWKCLAESWKTSGSGSTSSLKSRSERGTENRELLWKIRRRSHAIPSPAPLPVSSHGAAPPHPALNQTGFFLPEGRHGFPQESRGVLHPESWGSLILIPHLQLPAPGLHSLGRSWRCWHLAGPMKKLPKSPYCEACQLLAPPHTETFPWTFYNHCVKYEHRVTGISKFLWKAPRIETLLRPKAPKPWRK